MKNNPYKDLPPLERRPDGSPYRMTPAQRKQAASLIRQECCCCEDGNCIALDGWGHLHLPADGFFLGLLQVVPLGGLAAGRDAGSGDFPG